MARKAGMKVSSRISAEPMPTAVNSPKVRIVPIWNTIREAKLTIAVTPAATMTGPVRAMTRTMAAWFAARGSSGAARAAMPYSS